MSNNKKRDNLIKVFDVLRVETKQPIDDNKALEFKNFTDEELVEKIADELIELIDNDKTIKQAIISRLID